MRINNYLSSSGYIESKQTDHKTGEILVLRDKVGEIGQVREVHLLAGKRPVIPRNKISCLALPLITREVIANL